MYVPLQYVLLSPLSVRRDSASNVHIIVFFLLCLHVLCAFFALSIPHTVSRLFPPPRLDKSSFGSFPQRYIACVWLHVSDAFWLLEPPLPTQYLTASLSGLKQTHLFSPCFAFLLSSPHQLFNKCHKQHEKGVTVWRTVRRQPARRVCAILFYLSIYFNSNIPRILCRKELNLPGVWWTYSGSLCPVSRCVDVVFAIGSCCNSFLFFSSLLLPVNLYLCVCWASQPDTSCGVSRALTDWNRQPLCCVMPN